MSNNNTSLLNELAPWDPFLSFPPGTALALPPIFLTEKMAIRKRSMEGQPLLFRPLVWTDVDWTWKNRAQTYQKPKVPNTLWLKTWSKTWQPVLHVWATQKKTESVILVTISKGLLNLQQLEFWAGHRAERKAEKPRRLEKFLASSRCVHLFQDLGIGTMMGMMRVEACKAMSYTITKYSLNIFSVTTFHLSAQASHQRFTTCQNSHLDIVWRLFWRRKFEGVCSLLTLFQHCDSS